jgi:Family of unknown function (DUF6893)
MLRRLITVTVLVALVALVALVVAGLPDIKRFLRIREM